MTEAAASNFEIDDFVRVIDERDRCYGAIGPIVEINKQTISVQTTAYGLQKGFFSNELQHVSAVEQLAELADAEEVGH